MTIDEAIKHCEEVTMENLEKTKDRNASDPIAISCFECADEHRQLAEWLKDYKRLLEQEPCDDCIRRSDIGLTDFEIVMCNGDYKEGLKMLLDKIEKAPSATPMPKMGAWEWLSYEGIDEGNWHCSECRMIIPRMPIDDDGKPLYKCCPFCGSKNRGEE